MPPVDGKELFSHGRRTPNWNESLGSSLGVPPVDGKELFSHGVAYPRIGMSSLGGGTTTPAARRFAPKTGRAEFIAALQICPRLTNGNRKPALRQKKRGEHLNNCGHYLPAQLTQLLIFWNNVKIFRKHTDFFVTNLSQSYYISREPCC